MATVTMTVTDNAAGGISFHSSFEPAVGMPLTPAQVCALEMTNRTRKQWGLAPAAYQLQHGKLLVIHGAQGSGKTRAATEIAKRYSAHHHLLEFGVTFGESVQDALREKAQVLIIDGTPSEQELNQIKNMITKPHMMVRALYGQKKINVPTPRVIICTQSLDWLPDGDGSRRIDVIKLGKESVQ